MEKINSEFCPLCRRLSWGRITMIWSASRLGRVESPIMAHPVERQVRWGRMEEIRSASQAHLGECPR